METWSLALVLLSELTWPKYSVIGYITCLIAALLTLKNFQLFRLSYLSIKNLIQGYGAVILTVKTKLTIPDDVNKIEP
ncbi:hypothetical protein SAMN03159341_13133 [Paenibacillus sp. 1_12]|nr:hypothetical protein SAMN03159341_13133 [Paenibacillus sp. 1_12]